MGLQTALVSSMDRSNGNISKKSDIKTNDTGFRGLFKKRTVNTGTPTASKVMVSPSVQVIKRPYGTRADLESTTSTTTAATLSASFTQSIAFFDETSTPSTTEKVLKSILKDKKKTSSSGNAASGTNLKKKRVMFQQSKSGVRTSKVESFLKYASDLYWTDEEISKSKNIQTKSVEIDDNVKEYLRGLHAGRKQLRLQQSAKTGSDSQRSKAAIAPEYYKQILAGRTLGYAGLEHFAGNVSIGSSNNNTFDRRGDIERVVKSVVKYYKNQQKTKMGNMLESTSTTSSVDKTSSHEQLAEDVRSYARSFTAMDRTWGCILGRADMEASTTGGSRNTTISLSSSSNEGK